MKTGSESVESYSDIGGHDWSGNDNFRDFGFAGHLSTWNCLFADGHVKSLRPVATMTPLNMWGRFQDQFIANTDCTNVPDDDNPNCETPSAGALTKLGDLQTKYQ